MQALPGYTRRDFVTKVAPSIWTIDDLKLGQLWALLPPGSVSDRWNEERSKMLNLAVKMIYAVLAQPVMLVLSLTWYRGRMLKLMELPAPCRKRDTLNAP